MFKLCSSVKVKSPEATDEIFKQKAFSTNYDLKYSATKDFNDYDLCKLVYLGPLDYSYDDLVYFFGEPRIENNYDAYSFKQLVWFIKFNNGNICSISKHYRCEWKKKYLNNFKICGNNRSVLKDLVYVLK